MHGEKKLSDFARDKIKMSFRRFLDFFFPKRKCLKSFYRKFLFRELYFNFLRIYKIIKIGAKLNFWSKSFVEKCFAGNL